MSLNIVKLTEYHLQDIELQEHQKGTNFNDADYVNALINGGASFAGIKNDKVIVAAGFIEETKDRALMWGLFSCSIKHDMIHIFKALKKGIMESPYNRVYARVHTDFHAGIIFAEMLGLEYEGIEKQYIKGNDFAVFSKIKER